MRDTSVYPTKPHRRGNALAALLLRVAVLLGFLAMEAVVCSAGDGPLHAERLRCEYRHDPLGIDDSEPRLSWIVTSPQRGQLQSAYRVLVASSPEQLAEEAGNLWDSGQVDSDETVQIAYGGAPLTSRQPCFWKVCVWDREGHPSAWSPVARWSMGLLDESDWSARYISYRDETPVFKDRDQLFLPAPRQYRKPFRVQGPIRRATLYATALGIYELYLNGQRVGDAWFMPGWTDYHRRAYYNTYDVTDLVQEGKNALGAWVADGWYSGYVGFGLITGVGTEHIGRYMYGKTPAVMAQLELELEDGTRQIVVTDGTWKATGEGPIREADLLMGESYDATRENRGWATADFDDRDWETAILAKDAPPAPATFYEHVNPTEPDGEPKIEGRPIDLAFHRPKLEAFPGMPVRVTGRIKPVQIVRRGPGTYQFDMGQNFAGVVGLHVKGPTGQRIKLRYGEMLHPDGRLMTENLRKARAEDYYTCKGDPDGETYVPRFTFHGFRYVEVSNFPGEPNEETLTGLVIHSDTPLTSEFECSDPMVNRLFRNIIWTQRANFIDLPTDCPQRDERMGWTGDAQIYIGAATYNADVGAFYSKWLRELMESQRPSGTFPGYAPYPYQHYWDFGTAWCDAGVICPWTIWRAYGDTRIIERCWQPMTRFMDWRRRTSKNNLGINHGNEWGDWLAQGESTPLDYIDTVYLAQSARMMAEMAQAIGRVDEAADYFALFDRVKAAFQAKYVNDDGSLKVATQTAYALALYAGLVPDSARADTAKHLAEKIIRNGARMSTGFLGTRPLLPVLSSTDHHDLAVFLLQSHEFPSWGYEIDQGATTIWERWDGYTLEDGFGRHNASMNSFSHYAFGAVCEWMFRDLAGIRSDGPGYKRIIIRPLPPSPASNADHDPIDWVKASYDSIRGRISSEWRVDGKRFELTVGIPANTTATVYVPAADADGVTVGGTPVDQAEGVELLRTEAGSVVLGIESGSYAFASRDGVRPAGETFTTKSASAGSSLRSE